MEGGVAGDQRVPGVSLSGYVRRAYSIWTSQIISQHKNKKWHGYATALNSVCACIM